MTNPRDYSTQLKSGLASQVTDGMWGPEIVVPWALTLRGWALSILDPFGSE